MPIYSNKVKQLQLQKMKGIEDRKKQLLEYHKIYYEQHKEELKKKSYTNYKSNLEKLREIKMKENPDFKPRIRKRVVIDYYTSNEDTPENTDESENENENDK
jgi:hypothetical protein